MPVHGFVDTIPASLNKPAGAPPNLAETLLRLVKKRIDAYAINNEKDAGWKIAATHLARRLIAHQTTPNPDPEMRELVSGWIETLRLAYPQAATKRGTKPKRTGRKKK